MWFKVLKHLRSIDLQLKIILNNNHWLFKLLPYRTKCPRFKCLAHHRIYQLTWTMLLPPVYTIPVTRLPTFKIQANDNFSPHYFHQRYEENFKFVYTATNNLHRPLFSLNSADHRSISIILLYLRQRCICRWKQQRNLPHHNTLFILFLNAYYFTFGNI